MVPDLPAPWAFTVGRNTDVSFGVRNYREDLDRVVDFDELADSRWQVWLRAWDKDSDTTLILAREVPKSPLRKNWVRGAYYAGDTVRSGLQWEAVLVDTATAQAGTPSGKVELQLFTFSAAISDAPAALPP